ncbi:hypothetical protein [Candidatus Pelagibacter sp. Uisw_134_02]|jgi:hypothetical protein|uniref:hypothetical protein n=1 Tax=Candidatus Pelagibacter sp. Uisw_134_02 TaxID=3230990 RepID=UPI0039E74F9F
MFYKNIFFLLIFLIITNCTTGNLTNNKPSVSIIKGYTNKGFALVYNENLFKKKIINKKIEERSLMIFQKNLKSQTQVKITNILNGKSILATVGKNSKYPAFNNSVISPRIALELELNLNQPYVEILEILENSIFIAGKAKTFEEEKSVAVKAPVNVININDLNKSKKKDKKENTINFSYTVKIADFYFKDTASMMLNRIKLESSIKNPKIQKINDKKYRVYLGPFDNIYSLQKSYNDISILQFENIEIIKND